MNTMKKPLPKSVRIQLIAPPAFVAMVDKWRRKQADLPNRSEAIRRLANAGIKEKRNG